MKHVSVLAILLFCVAGFATETKKCVEKEVLITLRSTGSVHYSERDEGRVVGKVKILDCGQASSSNSNSSHPGSGNTGGVRPVCPPTVQDCIPR